MAMKRYWPRLYTPAWPVRSELYRHRSLSYVYMYVRVPVQSYLDAASASSRHAHVRVRDRLRSSDAPMGVRKTTAPVNTSSNNIAPPCCMHYAYGAPHVTSRNGLV